MDKAQTNTNDSKPLAKLLLKNLTDLSPPMPGWAISKCKKIGVVTVADLYRLTYFGRSMPGLGSRFGSVARDVLMGLGLPERIGLVDPIEAVMGEAYSIALRMRDEMIGAELAEQEAILRAGFDSETARRRELHEWRLSQIINGFRRREKILIAELKGATQQEMTFSAPDVSPELATRWLALHASGRVDDGFEIKAELTLLSRCDLPFMVGMTLVLSGQSIGGALVEYGNRSDAMSDARGRFFLQMPGSTVEVAETSMRVRFVSREPGKLASLEGAISIAGMTDGDIKKLLAVPKQQ